MDSLTEVESKKLRTINCKFELGILRDIQDHLVEHTPEEYELLISVIVKTRRAVQAIGDIDPNLQPARLIADDIFMMADNHASEHVERLQTRLAGVTFETIATTVQEMLDSVPVANGDLTLIAEETPAQHSPIANLNDVLVIAPFPVHPSLANRITEAKCELSLLPELERLRKVECVYAAYWAKATAAQSKEAILKLAKPFSELCKEVCITANNAANLLKKTAILIASNVIVSEALTYCDENKLDKLKSVLLLRFPIEERRIEGVELKRKKKSWLLDL